MALLCPKCGGKLIGICYGYPTYETFEKARQGKVFIGGCIREPYVHHCNHCNMSWTEDFSQCLKSENVFCQCNENQLEEK